jgi:hypothetical protein
MGNLKTERNNAMCEIGKPLEILNVEPLNLPAPLRREQEQPQEQPVTIEVPVTAEAVLVERV